MNIKSDRRMVQLALCLAVFLVPFMGSSLNLAMPLVAADFKMSAFSLTFLVSSYLATAAMLQMPAARLADLVGRRRVFLLGLAVFAVFSLLSGLAWSGASLIAFRFAAGAGSAMVFATNMAILTAVYPPEMRGKVLGVNTAVVYAAVAAGPLVGGVIAQHTGWRSIFFASVALALAAIYASVKGIRDEWIESKGEPYDYPGSAVFALSVAGFIFGASFLPGTAGWIMLGAGAAAALLFVRLAKRAAYPVVKLDLFFDNRHFRLATLSAMINYAASFAIGFVMSLYLQYVHGLLPDMAGLAMMAQPVAQTLLSPLFGKISDRVNPSLLTTGGMLLITAGLAALTQLGTGTPIWFVVAILTLVGVGFAMFSSPNVNIIMGSVSRRDSGLASAATGTARQVGQSMSIAIASLVIHAYMADAPLTMDNTHAFLPALRTAFWIFAAICLAGAYASASKLTGGAGDKEWRSASARMRGRGDGKE